MGDKNDRGNMGDMGDRGDRGGRGGKTSFAGSTVKRAGYEYLLAYKLTVPIYDYTVIFCRRYLIGEIGEIREIGGIREEAGSQSRVPQRRTADQMIQAARSGMSNIVEGNKHVSLKGYIYLAGIARGSLEELLKDYLSFGRQRNIRIWEIRESREMGEVGEIWEYIKIHRTLPDSPHFPSLPDNPEKAVNLMITLIHQTNYLLDKLIVSLKEKHRKEGGLTERLYRERVAYRGDKGGKGR